MCAFKSTILRIVHFMVVKYTLPLNICTLNKACWVSTTMYRPVKYAYKNHLYCHYLTILFRVLQAPLRLGSEINTDKNAPLSKGLLYKTLWW